jgi:hypothetical protein
MKKIKNSTLPKVDNSEIFNKRICVEVVEMPKNSNMINDLREYLNRQMI